MKKCWCGNDKLCDYSESYFKCNKCNTLISKRELETAIYNVQDEAKDLYGKNYWEVSMIKASGKSSISEIVDMYLTERVPYWLQYILKYVKLGSSVAEVGCGLGQLQYVMKRLGYNQLAYELSPDICNYIENNLGVKAHCGSMEEQRGKYDGILAFDLLEHLMDPLQFMEQCEKSLKETGVLCFQTPCYNPQFSYEEIKKIKGRFEEQLKSEQHIYLYSKESITELLRKFGFRHIIFEPAYFGDDYDMFLFASRSEIAINSQEEIDTFLNSAENGRLVKAILYVSEEKEKLFNEFQSANRDRIERLIQIEKLSAQLEKKEQDNEKRLKNINVLTGQLKESEIDRAARAEQIDILTNQLNEKNTSEAVYVEQIESLTRQLKESEADRSARAEQIDILTRQLKESETDRAARAEQIDVLTRQLKESEEDRSARLEQINVLTQMVNEIRDH